MLVKKIFTVFLVYTFILAGCATKNTHVTSDSIGPKSSSELKKQQEIKEQEETIATEVRPKIDVIIPIFDPGLPEDPEDYKKNNIWPELRRSEANRFAWKLKEAMDETGKFGAVRVTPDSSATGGLYVLGEIVESNGEEVEIDIIVVDISGNEWLDESYDHTVSEDFFTNPRNKEKDPYNPVFEKAAQDITEELKDHDDKELSDLHYLADIRFGAGFSEPAFGQFMSKRNGKTRLIAKPSEDDPMYSRIKSIRVRDQMFVDSMQSNYAAFSSQMDKSYRMWQEQSQIEVKAAKEAEKAKWANAIGGTILVGLAVLSGVAGARSDSYGGSTAGATGAIIGGMAGAAMINESFKTSEEAKMHRDAINELGQSLDMELSSQVVAFEKQTVELTGNAKEQYDQWRDFLQKIYEQETTPDVQL